MAYFSWHFFWKLVVVSSLQAKFERYDSRHFFCQFVRRHFQDPCKGTFRVFFLRRKPLPTLFKVSCVKLDRVSDGDRDNFWGHFCEKTHSKHCLLGHILAANPFPHRLQSHVFGWRKCQMWQHRGPVAGSVQVYNRAGPAERPPMWGSVLIGKRYN